MKTKNKIFIVIPILVIAFVFAIMGVTFNQETVIASAAEGTTTIYVENKSAASDTDVQVNVLIRDNVGVAGATLKLSYDNRLTLKEASNGEVFSSLNLTMPGVYSNPCNFLWDALDQSSNGDGVILTLTFALAKNISDNTKLYVEVSAEYGDIIDNDINFIDVAFERGNITVINFTPGDVNDDGRINVVDVTMLRRYIAGGYGININEAAADVNDDGRINIVDVTMLRRFIAGGYGVELKPSTHFYKHVHDLAHVEAVSSTCDEDGNIEYWYCSECDCYFSDSAAETEIPANSAIIAALGHDYQAVVTAPTCTEQGFTTYTCSHCGDIYIDNYTEALGHDYVFVGIVWSEDTAKAEYVCSNEEDHVIYYDCEMSYEVLTESSCETDGTAIYTAEYDCHSEQKTLTIKATGHQYSEEWGYDSEYHWHEMVCGHEEDVEDINDILKDYGEHYYDEETHLCVCGRKETVLLRFVDYNGNALYTLTKEYGEQIDYNDDITIPTRDNYSFVGWSVNGEIVEELVATASVELIAEYVRSYTVRFIVDDVIYSEQIVSEGGNAIVPEQIPSKKGNIFEGWTDYSDITSDRVVNAEFCPIEYCVTFFDTDGQIIGETQTIIFGDTITLPSVDQYYFESSTNKMYMFSGWDFKESQNWNFDDIENEVLSQVEKDQTITPSIEITAKYDMEYNLPFIILEERTDAEDETVCYLSISIVIPENIYLYAIDLKFSYGVNESRSFSIVRSTVNTGTVIYNEDTTYSTYSNKTKTFNFIWTRFGEGITFEDRQIIDTIQFERPNGDISITDGNIVLLEDSSLIYAMEPEASYGELREIVPIVVYKKR